MKLKDLFEPFIENAVRCRRSLKTIKGYRSVQNEIIEYIGECDIESLAKLDCNKLRTPLAIRGYSIERKGMITLRKLVEYAKDCGYKISLDWRDIKLPKDKYNEPQALTDREIEAVRHCLIQRMKSDKQRATALRMYTLLELNLRTGLRPTEALSLSWKDINFIKEEITIVNCKTKDVEVVDCVGVTKWLKELRRTTEYLNCEAVFLSDDDFGRGLQAKRMGYQTAKRYMYGLREATGIKILSLYIFRKTYITGLLEMGFSVREAQKLGRHKSVSTTLMYYAAVERSAARKKNRVAMASAWEHTNLPHDLLATT